MVGHIEMVGRLFQGVNAPIFRLLINTTVSAYAEAVNVKVGMGGHALQR